MSNLDVLPHLNSTELVALAKLLPLGIKEDGRQLVEIAGAKYLLRAELVFAAKTTALSLELCNELGEVCEPKEILSFAVTESNQSDGFYDNGAGIFFESLMHGDRMMATDGTSLAFSILPCIDVPELLREYKED